MKTERRHELQTNTLAEMLGGGVEASKPYVTVALGVIVALAVLVGAYFVLSSRSQGEEEQGWNQYFQAVALGDREELAAVARSYADSEVGYWASLQLGDRHLNEGVNQLFSDRPKANEELKDAEDSYIEAAKSDDALIRQRAQFGLARTYEAQFELDDARKTYEALVQEYPKGLFVESAKRRIDELSEKSTKRFYDWFADQKVKPPAEASGTGERPAFNLDSLPDRLPNSIDEMPSTDLDGSGDDDEPASSTDDAETPDGTSLDDRLQLGDTPAGDDTANDESDPAPSTDTGTEEPLDDSETPDGATPDEDSSETETEPPADPDAADEPEGRSEDASDPTEEEAAAPAAE
jgi:hypothetical protein